MTLDAALKTINCTSCGAGLDVLGGGRVIAHICSYCGAELDVQDNYKVLAKFDGLKRPESPFQIGMIGQIHGAEYTVIGTLELTENWGGSVWKWVDHQLYSATHGYAWLTIEKGHLIFTRRYRDAIWISEAQVERAENRPSIRSGGKFFNYYETTTSKITFAEGEFTWAPRIGDRSTTVSALGDTAMLSFSQTGDEREIYRSTYLDRAEVEAGFGVATNLTPEGTHALQIFKAGENFSFTRNAALACAVGCLMLAGYMEMRPGTELAPRQSFFAQNLPQTISFDVTDATGLTQINLTGDTHNGWSYLGIELEDPEGEPLFEAGRTLEYYTGRDSEGTWSEGNNRASLLFHPETTGTYRLTLSVEEAGLWSNIGSAASQITVAIRGGLSSGFWLMLLAIGFGLTAGAQYARRAFHRMKRWGGSDWTDED